MENRLWNREEPADPLQLVAVGRAGPDRICAGVDVEWLEKAIDVDALVDFVLSRREQDGFKRLDPHDRRKAFLQCWTIKEAYLKAIVSARGGGCLRRAGSRPKPCRVNRWLRHPSSLGQRLGDDRHLCDSGANPGWHINDHIHAY